MTDDLAYGSPAGGLAGDDLHTIAFTHTVLCQVGFPRARVEGREFLRRSGQAWLSVQAGWLDEGHGPVAQPVPYGAMPRLALAWISTHAVRHRTRTVPIGDSAAAFLRAMGMGSEGPRYRALRTHMHALAACRLQLGFRGRTFSGQPVERFDAWAAVPGRPASWPGVLVLSEAYFASLLDGAVPLEQEALVALRGSALALDVYAWLAHRLHRIGERALVLAWSSLFEQFGQEYRGRNAAKDFRREFKRTLARVRQVYPAADIAPVPGGLRLRASPPPVAYRAA